MRRDEEARLPHLLAISENVRRLTIGWATVTEGHRAMHPGLLRQARLTMVHAGGAGEDESDRKVHAKPVVSKPPMPEHIFHTILECEAFVAILAAGNGVEERGDPESTLRALVGHCGELEDKELVALDRDLAHLRRRLEVALSWEPQDRPLRGARCPECEGKGGLYVKIDEHGPIGAYCSACKTRWPREGLTALADTLNKEEKA